MNPGEVKPVSQLPSLDGERDISAEKRWHDELEEQVELAHKNGTPLSVLFIDVNHFKDVNDTLGHEAGDRVLHEIDCLNTELAESFRLNRSDEHPLRPIDSVLQSEAIAEDKYRNIGLRPSRIGGDEFGIICHTDEMGVEIIVARLRAMFEAHMEKSPHEFREIELGLSIGSNTLSEGMDASELLRGADEAMFEDKRKQLPSLKWLQKRSLKIGKYLVQKSGVRLRDLAKYEEIDV